MGIRTETITIEVCDGCGEDIKSNVRKVYVDNKFTVATADSNDKRTDMVVVSEKTIYHTYCLKKHIEKVLSQARGGE